MNLSDLHKDQDNKFLLTLDISLMVVVTISRTVMRHESTKIVASVLWHRPCKLQVPKIRILCLVTCFYGIVTEIWNLNYNMFNICVFKCDWVDSKNGVKVDELGFTLVDLSKIGHK